MKPKPHCTPRMLDALRNLHRWGMCIFPVPVWWQLKSRGWMDWNGNITQRGLAYLTARGYIGDLLN